MATDRETGPADPGAPEPESVENDAPAPASFKPKSKQVIIAVAVTVGILVLVFGVMLPSIVSYEDIWAAIRDMEPWNFAVLLGIWLFKVPCDGLIYARSLPGLKVRQGSLAWSGSTAFSNVIPGPGDLLVRLSMYRTWGYQVDQSMISMTTSGILQNVNRLSLPVIGVVWYAADSSEDVAGWLIVLALIGLAVLAAGVVFGVMVIRSEAFALRVGGWVERVVNWVAAKLKRDAPDDMVGKLIGWRDAAKDLIRERWWQLWLAHFATTVVDVVLLTAALRFAGVSTENLSLAEIFLSYALVQLVTLIPITNGNIGIAEIAYILFLDAFASGGDAVTGAIAAGVIIFRIYNWLLVIPVGFTATAIWRNIWKKRLGFDPFTILLQPEEREPVTD